MIKVTRTPAPIILQEKGSSWTEEICTAQKKYYQDLNNFKQKKQTQKPIKPKIDIPKDGHKPIINQLKTMFNHKCAYCEASLKSGTFPEIEHFRPKSIYPQLTCNWDNLLLACRRCNTYKSTQFPLMDNTQPQKNLNDPCLLDDTANNALINPCVDDPSEIFIFIDEKIVYQKDNYRAKKTIEVLKLDNEDLEDDRRRMLKYVELIAKTFLLALQENNKEKELIMSNGIKDLVSKSTPFSAMNKAKFKALGIDITQFETN